MTKTKKNRKKRARTRRGERDRNRDDPAQETPPPSTLHMGQDGAANTKNEQLAERPHLFTTAVRVTGIAPIALLIVALASHEYWPWRTPQWFQSIVGMEVAVLTLSAGHAGIIGLLMSTGGRFTGSTYVLLIAAVATALAGLRTIGDSTPGLVVALMLIFLTVPAVWPDAVSANLRWFCSLFRSRQGLFGLLAGATIVIIAYNQSKDADYIRNWILIPLGILVGIVLGATVVWVLLRLSYRFIPVLLSWLWSRAATVYGRVRSRT